MGDHLATYLTDHMAGSVAAVELLERFKEEHGDDPIGRTATQLLKEIADERKVLDDLAERVGASVTLPRKAASWIAEKAAQLKLRYDDPQGGPLRRMESFEALSLGIEGKRLLWRALATASARRLELAGPDYDGLIALAEDQRRRVEVHRLAAAEEALTAGTGTTT
ncbi:hypothetical protein [Planctomyces sp. SH-PL62]|uniref:hypothetical protein n=1 Tax=Planctomyces sp. SH-PL62 TaxID=1636152 RepID=UPI00078BE83D|nr:hypothetical protein [Planctomyces sp. SH-PL62]AMV37954.1 hypothetical protein VT85_10995 [Planctomyces sp. SH-PL62]